MNDPEEPDAEYANYFEIGHNPLEVLLNFGRRFDGESRERFHTRIVMNPSDARAFFELLREVIAAYSAR